MSTNNENYLNDPRLTAYLLGELDADEQAQVEAWLKTSPEGRAQLAELQATTESLFAALQRESTTPTPQRDLSATIQQALALPKEVRDTLVSTPTVAVATPTSNSHAGSALLATFGTIAALVVAGVVCLQSDYTDSGLANHRSQTPTPLQLTDSSGKSDFISHENLGLSRQSMSDLEGELAEQIVVSGVSPRPVDLAKQTEQQGQVNSPGQTMPSLSFNINGTDQQRSLKTVTDNLSAVSQTGPAPTPPNVAATPQPSQPAWPGYAQYDNYAAVTYPNQYDANAFPQVPMGWRSTNLQWNDRSWNLRFGKQSSTKSDGLAASPVDSGMPLPQISQGAPAGLKSHTIRNLTELSTALPDAVMLNIQTPPTSGKAFRLQEAEISQQQLAGIEAKGRPIILRDDVQTYPYYTVKDLDHFYDESLSRRKQLETYRLRLMQEEAYAPLVENEFVSPEDQPYSTFSIDVDTGSYANVRRFLHNNQLPPPNAVRLEELINSFEYNLQAPNEEHPVAVTLDSTTCPWETSHQLVRIGLKAKEIDAANRPPTSLVFLIDVSGSMEDANKLPLAKEALRLLVEQMQAEDRIAIVTYASQAGVALESTNGSQKELILEKIDSLSANGSTNGEDGLQLAYKIAAENRIEEGANRILVCTDGDFNVGTSEDDAVFKLMEEHRQTGVFLSVLGFGTGNLKDSKLEGIANRGNGHYSYIDRLAEAQNVLVKHLTGTLYTVAKDVKLQVEFNPTKVESYRLLGYENRALAAKDFNNDNVDAGEMGAGHTVTALYEVAIIGATPQPEPGVDAPRYQQQPAQKPEPKDTAADTEVTHGEELLFVKLRYKQPEADESTKVEVPLLLDDEQPASDDLQWAANVASFGMLLRDSKFKGDATWDSLLARTRATLKEQHTPERMEFVDLVLRGRGLWRVQHGHESAVPSELLSLEARKKATCEEQYQTLLDKFERPADAAFYGDFFEFGFRNGEKFLGKEGVPDGYWVYVYPNWYVWGEQTK